MAPIQIVSGGQSGVDRAALDVALALAIPCGGWCPLGRRAEDGPIALRYPLRETGSRGYEERTERNVRDSDATLVLTRGPADGGTALTIRLAEQHGKPCLVLDLGHGARPEDVAQWVRRKRVRVLNVAGPRESKQPGIYGLAEEFLQRALALLRM